MVSEEVQFEPWLEAEASVRFFNAKRNIDVVQKINLRQYLDESFVRSDWDAAEDGLYTLAECKSNPRLGSRYYSLPSSIRQMKDFRELSKGF